jgi:ketosteroid isomerase-like protein
VAKPEDCELLMAAYAFFNERDLESALTTMHEDVDWPNGMEGGRVHGHGGVREYWTRQWGTIDPHVEPVGFESEADGRVAVTVHQTVRELNGQMLADLLLEHVYRIEDGRIRSMEIRELAAK